MKLSKHAFMAIWDVHAWLGVWAGLVLHVMCFTGAFCVFYEELGMWQDPALHAPHGDVRPLTELVRPMLDSGQLGRKRIDVYLPDEERSTVDVRYVPAAGGVRRMTHVNPRTGEVIPDRSRLASILLYVHFLYHDRWFPQGIFIAGVFGVAMGLGLVTGVVIHFRKIFRELHQFRAHKRSGIVWADAHKILAVFGLPFQSMAAFTGAMICFGPLLLKLFAGPVFHSDAKAADRALYGDLSGPAASSQRAAPIDLDQLVAKATDALPGLSPDVLRFVNYGDAEGTVGVFGKRADSPLGTSMVRLRLRDGAVVRVETPGANGPAQNIEQWIRSLHFVRYGGWTVRILYALCALAACLTILTGNWVWLLRRETREARASNRVLSRMTVAAGGGVCLATAVLFWANRCIPMHLPWRMTAESVAFFGTWGLALLGCLLASNARKSWVVLLVVSGALFASVPVFDVRHHLGGIDVALFVLGVGLLGAARLVHTVRASWST
ncbi:PepSY domain-containing protein [Pendulispora rubella]|uniref:PepSY domain-containing protein n=1 Tax=Pendulispora rubella TaxID=2741070 RepID=A0ABZ2LA17_9BACT